MTSAGVIVHQESRIYAALLELAQRARLVFFAGLPGSGKSLMIHQLAHIAHGCGRPVHLLQWDVARPMFESSESGRRYPQVDGVTHGVIRLAAGRWARDTIGRWHENHPDARHILIGETPLIGHRFVELARPALDAAEPVLTQASTRFVIPVPSAEVRRHLETERERRARRPLHEREKEDAPPQVLRELWQEFVAAGRSLGVSDSLGTGVDYDPLVYQGVYQRVLNRRHTLVLPLNDILPTASFSAYDFAVPHTDVLPGDDEVRRWIGDVEAAYPDPGVLHSVIERWYVNQ